MAKKRKTKRNKKLTLKDILVIILIIIWVASALHQFYLNYIKPQTEPTVTVEQPNTTVEPTPTTTPDNISVDDKELYNTLASLRYNGSAYKVINDGVPFFKDETYETEFEIYSGLDDLGRCGPAFANISPLTLPEGKRGDISKVKPTGWHSYNAKELFGQPLIDNTQSVYNRSHLIAYSLTAEDANKENLITGTRYLNMNMTDFETEVLNYVRKTQQHVLYRVTPIFEGDNLLANGVLMEAKSVEDPSVQYCVYLFNVQPLKDGTMIEIDYKTGEIKH